MAKGPDWNNVHRANPGAVRDALTEPDIPFDDAPLVQPNGNGEDYLTEEELRGPPRQRERNLAKERRARPDGEAKLKHFELIPFDKITFDPAPAYHVKDLLCSTGLIVVWGAPKCGKSFWTFDLVMHVALGWAYRGRRVKQGTVVYCALEGATAFRNRVEAFRKRHMAECVSEVPFYLMPTPMALVADHPALNAAIQAELGGKLPAIVVIDTLNRSLAGSESSDEDMSLYIQAADAIRAAFGCAVVIVHHCGHEGIRPRGHSSLLGALDVQIGVTRSEADDIIAEVELMKDGEAGAKIVSRLDSIEVGIDSDGDKVTSCVIVEGDKDAAKAKPKEASMASILRTEYLASFDDVADGAPKVPGHTSKLVAKIETAKVRDHLKNRGFLEKDDRGNLTAAGRQQLRTAKTALLKARTLVEQGDFIWRP